MGPDKVALPMSLGEAVSRGIIANETLGYFIGRTHLFLVRPDRCSAHGDQKIYHTCCPPRRMRHVTLMVHAHHCSLQNGVKSLQLKQKALTKTTPSREP